MDKQEKEMKERYGETQVREIYFTRYDVQQVLAENIRARGCTAYDFDYNFPIFIWEKDGSVQIRFIQRGMTQERDCRSFNWSDLPKEKK